MKKLILFLLCVVFTLSMSACGGIGEENTANKPTSTEPPVLQIMDSACTIQANTGTYTWTYDNGDGTKSGVCADSSHPLEWQEFLVPMVTSDDTIQLNFAVQPQEFIVRCWSDAYWGSNDAVEETVAVTGNTLELKSGGYIYEVAAKWTGENLAAEGDVTYGFYVVQDDHTHTPADQPQTVADPVSGYCGNTVTTIYIDGEECSFWGSDSVTLTDILINLLYDPAKVCRCPAEFSVGTEFASGYEVNLTEGFARCPEGQGDLTQTQIKQITLILDNQT